MALSKFNRGRTNNKIIIIIIIINTLFILQKNRSAEYEKAAGINLCAVIKYFKIKKKKTIVHGKKAERLIFRIEKGVKNLNELIYNVHLCCVLSCCCKYLNVFLLKDPNVRPSTRNSLGNSFQSFAPVNLKVDWPIVDLTLGR